MSVDRVRHRGITIYRHGRRWRFTWRAENPARITDLSGLRTVFAVAVTVQLLAVINAARRLSDDQLAPAQSTITRD